jgi:hypothetical protein
MLKMVTLQYKMGEPRKVGLSSSLSLLNKRNFSLIYTLIPITTPQRNSSLNGSPMFLHLTTIGFELQVVNSPLTDLYKAKQDG